MPYKDRGLWRAVIYRNGRRVSKGFPTRAEAVAWEVGQKSASTSEPLALSNLVAKHLQANQPTILPKTFRRKIRVFKSFLAHFGDIPVDTILPGNIQEYFVAQSKAGRGPVAVNDDRKSLLAFWRWCQVMYEVKSNPVVRVQKMPEPKNVQYVPPPEDIKKLLNTAKGEDRAWLQTYLLTGARESEVYRLTWEDVDFEQKRIRFYSRKNKERTSQATWLPMSKALVAILKKWLGESPYTGPAVFPAKQTGRMLNNARCRLRDLCARAGIRDIPFHALRRFVGTSLARAGEPMQLIQVTLRHKRLATTEKYLGADGVDITSTMDRLAEIYTTPDTTAKLSVLK